MRAGLYGIAAIVAMMAATSADAADERSFTGGRFVLDIAGQNVGFAGRFGAGPGTNFTVQSKDLQACESFPGTVCGDQQIIFDSSNFTQGQDVYDIIGFGYDPGNCCQVLYLFFPDGAFYQRGFYQSIGQGVPATLQITAVPEPDSWALLIAGFGLTGAVLRRRRPAIA
jgi:hypothetical protein